MSELGDSLRAIRQRAIDSGELRPEEMLSWDEIDAYRGGWLDEWRELKWRRLPWWKRMFVKRPPSMHMRLTDSSSEGAL